MHIRQGRAIQMQASPRCSSGGTPSGYTQSKNIPLTEVLTSKLPFMYMYMYMQLAFLKSHADTGWMYVHVGPDNYVHVHVHVHVLRTHSGFISLKPNELDLPIHTLYSFFCRMCSTQWSHCLSPNKSQFVFSLTFGKYCQLSCLHKRNVTSSSPREYYPYVLAPEDRAFLGPCHNY